MAIQNMPFQLGRTVVRTVQKGFTLVEMVVVILIIGVLLGIAIPAYTYYNKAAWNAAISAQAKSMLTGYLSVCANNVNNLGAVNTAVLVSDMLKGQATNSTSPLGGPWTYNAAGAGTVVATSNAMTVTLTPSATGCSGALPALAVGPAVPNSVFATLNPVVAVTAGGGMVYTPGN